MTKAGLLSPGENPFDPKYRAGAKPMTKDEEKPSDIRRREANTSGSTSFTATVGKNRYQFKTSTKVLLALLALVSSATGGGALITKLSATKEAPREPAAAAPVDPSITSSEERLRILEATLQAHVENEKGAMAAHVELERAALATLSGSLTTHIENEKEWRSSLERDLREVGSDVKLLLHERNK